MPSFDEVMSTGKEHQRFDSGSKRDSAQGKGRPDLLPVHALFRIGKACDPDIVPIHGIIRLAVHYENGAMKYGDRNWELGQPFSRYVASAFRHLMKWVGGAREEDHLAAVAWNAAAIIDHEERIKRGLLDAKWNDMPKNKETGVLTSVFLSTDVQVRPWKVDAPISEHAWTVFDHVLWWMGGDRTVDHMAIIARGAMSMMEIEERLERNLIDSSVYDLDNLPKIFLPGEFVEADKRRKEKDTESKRNPVLLVEDDVLRRHSAGTSVKEIVKA